MEITPQNIYSFRKNNGMTREGMAKKLGVSTGTLANWEKGFNKPHPRSRKKLLKLMEKTYVKGANPYIPKISHEEADIITEYKGLYKHEVISAGFMVLGEKLCSSPERAKAFVEAVIMDTWEIIQK